MAQVWHTILVIEGEEEETNFEIEELYFGVKIDYPGPPLQIWARPNILPQIFLTGCFLSEHIETTNSGKARALEALVAVAPLSYVLKIELSAQVSDPIFFFTFWAWTHL